MDENKKKFIEKLIDDSTIIEEMSLELGCVDEFFSDGGIVFALKPLSERFQWDVIHQADNHEFNKVTDFDTFITLSLIHI